MVNHLTSHLTFLAHDRLIVLTDPLFYCLDRPLFIFSIVSPLLFLTHCSPKAIVRLLRTLSQVATSVVYKLACIVERGLKPDLVFYPSVVAFTSSVVCLYLRLLLSPSNRLKVL